MKSWARPSIIPVKDTWVGNLGVAYFFQIPETWRDRPLSGFVDAYVYVGLLDSLSHERTRPASWMTRRIWMSFAGEC